MPVVSAFPHSNCCRERGKTLLIPAKRLGIVLLIRVLKETGPHMSGKVMNQASFFANPDAGVICGEEWVSRVKHLFTIKH